MHGLRTHEFYHHRTSKARDSRVTFDPSTGASAATEAFAADIPGLYYCRRCCLYTEKEYESRHVACGTIEILEQNAANGDADAMNILAAMYKDGQGVHQSFAKAIEFYAQTAAKGNAEAMLNLGLMHENGQGVPQSFAKAIEFYEQAAAKGNAQALYYLGTKYYQGHGVPQSFAKAFELFEQATQGIRVLGGLSSTMMEEHVFDEEDATATRKMETETLDVLFASGLPSLPSSKAVGPTVPFAFSAATAGTLAPIPRFWQEEAQQMEGGKDAD